MGGIWAAGSARLNRAWRQRRWSGVNAPILPVDVRRLRIYEGDTVRGRTICGGINKRVVDV